MKAPCCLILVVAGLGQSLSTRADAQVVSYTNEAAFMNALAAQGFVPTHEGFEDDAVWGSVRSTIVGGPNTAASVENLGITWSSSSANNGVTTSQGAARTGAWGFYSRPHGDYANGITDGWRGTASQPLVAIGGWVQTNTPPAALVVFLDGNEQGATDFDGSDAVSTTTSFFGVINPSGFTAFDYRESEGTIGDQKFIFGDDFTFAFGGVVQDCNENGMTDGFDINSGTSSDCNHNHIPDECEISEASLAPGGPYFCTVNCADDCNDNGIPDECEAVTPQVYASGQLSPIGFGSPQSFVIMSPPPTLADVVLTFTARANLGGAPDHVSVEVNGVPVGTVFGPDGNDCPENQPDLATLVVPMGTFNSAVGAGDAVIDMVASEEVGAFECSLPTYIAVEAQLFVPSPADQNGDGILDECACVPFVRGEVNGDGMVTVADVVYLLAFYFSGGPEPMPVLDAGDANGEGTIDISDPVYLLGYLFNGEPQPPAPFPDAACGG